MRSSGGNGELFQRLEQHLAAGDFVRTQHGPALTAGIEAFRPGAMAVEQARTASSLAQTALDVAEESFDRLVEKVYATLIDRTGCKAAERFFPVRARVRCGASTHVRCGSGILPSRGNGRISMVAVS